MAANDAYFSVSGYVATQPKPGRMKDGTQTLSFRLAWTPRALDRASGEWADLPSSFASVTCYRKLAEHGMYCLRRGDPVVLKGTLRVREYVDQAGARRNSVDVVANFLGHDMTKGTSMFSKQPQHAEQTAAEYQQSQTAAHDPRPGDVAALQHQGEPQRALGADEETGRADGTGLVSEGAGDDGDSGDFDEADDLPDSDGAGREPEPIGAGA